MKYKVLLLFFSATLVWCAATTVAPRRILRARPRETQSLHHCHAAFAQGVEPAQPEQLHAPLVDL